VAVKITARNAGEFAGRSDWRLPNVNELATLLHFGAMSPATDALFASRTAISVPIAACRGQCGCLASPRTFAIASPAMLEIRVLELGCGLAAAYATRLLVDLGAAVTKVEPPQGDPLRRRGPVPRGGVDRGSGLFAYLNAGKGSVVLDAAAAADRGRLSELAAQHDILIESLGPGRLEETGLVHGEATAPPRTVVRISPFGQTGPYRDRPATSAVLQAAGGWAARIGTPEGPPYFVGGSIEEYAAGAYAAAAALTAYRQADATGERVEVDVSIFECIVGTVPYPMLQKIAFDRLGFPVPQRYQPIPGIMRCRDGSVGISALTGQHWSDVCALLEIPELGEKMREVTLRGDEWQKFIAKAEPWLLERNAAEIVELFQAMRVPAVPIGNGANLPTLEPFASRDFYVRQPGSGFLRPRSPLRLSATPAPMLRQSSRGAGGRDGAATLAPRAGQGARSSWGGGREGLPFSGLRVLDFTTFWAGPYFTMYLASFGADVVKVESPKHPDGFRFVAAFPQLGERWWEQSGVFHATNLGKRAITLDLEDARGKELARRLVADADVVAENFSPRVIEHFGLGYEAIRDLNPRAIVVRMPGFGLSGPCRDWVGWALTFEQMAGCAEITGEPGGRMFAPGGFADPVVGMHAAAALQAAIAHRERTGEGQLIEVAQVETVAAMTAEQVIHFSLTGVVLTRNGNRSDEAAPQGIYRAAGNDDWIALGVRDAGEWSALCGVIGRDDLRHDSSLADVVTRRARHDEIDRAIEAWAATRTARDAERELVAANIPAAKLLKTEDFYADAHLAKRCHFRTLDHEVCGPLAYPGWPLRFSSGPVEPYATAAPTLGRHNDEVLRGVLGLSQGEIDGLRAARVIGESM
jgi:crotonobetainyl-CoA:carnitine CoA-transferase CaiB-like acyl-CoA transferase